jgi:hypothetical protein
MRQVYTLRHCSSGANAIRTIRFTFISQMRKLGPQGGSSALDSLQQHPVITNDKNGFIAFVKAIWGVYHTNVAKSTAILTICERCRFLSTHFVHPDNIWLCIALFHVATDLHFIFSLIEYSIAIIENCNKRSKYIVFLAIRRQKNHCKES